MSTMVSKADRLLAYLKDLAQMYTEKYGCEIPPFEVIYKNRKTKNKLGSYDPITAAITIYNHVGNNEEECHTCIHELTHHLQHRIKAVDSDKLLPSPGREHGATFELHLHRLVTLAKEKGYYTEPFLADPVLKELVTECRGLKVRSGESALRMGELLSHARDRCHEVKASFELFLTRGCDVHRSLAYDYIRAWDLKLPADLGILKMRFVLQTPEHLREQAIKDIRDGVPIKILNGRYRPDSGGAPPTAEEVQWDPARELQRLRALERQLVRKLQWVKKRRIELETRVDTAPSSQDMSNDSTLAPQPVAAESSSGMGEERPELPF